MPTNTDRRPTSRRARVLRYLGDAFLTIGIARGTSPGERHGGHADHLLARSVLFTEGRRTADDERPTGLLDRVPGWLILACVGILLLVALLAPR